MKMELTHRNLILAAELQGFIHDLGKLRPEFAREKSKGGESLIKNIPNALQYDAHGAILEEARAYPPTGEDDWLKEIKEHPGWAAALRLPEDWIQPGTVQAHGLGDALRQHHANNDFPKTELSLLGDLYTLGADGRDSALDKGSGQTLHGEQRPGHAFRADSFGNESDAYEPTLLNALWHQAATAIQDELLAEGVWEAQRIPKTRARFLKRIESILRQALGDTRRPTNDVTLWHHSYSTASLFKAAVAECVLRRNFGHLQDQQGLFDQGKMGRVRFRLLGIRWDWVELLRGALRPVVFAALQAERQDAMNQLRKVVECDYPIGNVIYEDHNGAVIVTPSFFELDDVDGQGSEKRYRESVLDPLLPDILNALVPLGPGTAIRIAWTAPALYLTDYPEVLGVQMQGTKRELLRQVGEVDFRRMWEQPIHDGPMHICPQCGLRPARAHELALTESQLDDTELCEECRKRSPAIEKMTKEMLGGNRYQHACEWFGIWPETFNLHKLRQARSLDNPRLALISVQIDPSVVANGEVLLTQLARPSQDFREKKLRNQSPTALGKALCDLLDQLGEASSDKWLQENISKNQANQYRELVGDGYWLDFQPSKPENIDGRVNGSAAEKSLRLADEFFFREHIPKQFGLYRHDGDRLLLFGMRKHASPGRLARLWNDLYDLWKSVLAGVNQTTEGYIVPLSLDARGVRFLVAAADAGKALMVLPERLDATLSKVRAGLQPHVSALVCREKFPLYLALDGLRRMEGRMTSLPMQSWKLQERCEEKITLHRLKWQTPQGPVTWSVNFATGDPEQDDLWHPHVICVSRPEGPERLVHLRDLSVGETIALRPATFDFAVLEGSARRYDLRYEARSVNAGDDGDFKLLYRPHFILGDRGRAPYLLEQMPAILTLASETRWNASQAKAILGQIIECYEKWVRDAPPALRPDGHRAWHTHTKAILRRYLSGNDRKSLRDWMEAHLDDGGLFDAFEWFGFVEKQANSSVDQKRQHG